jgi:hypothetical protein
MDMEELFERLVAIMDANKEDLLAKIDARRENMGTSHKEMVSEFKPEIEEETVAYQEMEARQDEQKPTPVNRKPEAAEHQEEVPKEDAIAKPVNGRKRRHRGKKQAAGRREEPKKLNRGDWIPDEVGCRLQEGVPPCNSSMAQKDHPQKIYDPKKVWASARICCRQKSD